MVQFPFCKINLGLSVVSRREDGYHNLETCFYPVPWTDVLEIIPGDKFLFTSSGSVIAGDPEENLCVKAYYRLRKEFDIKPVSMHLHKIIPMGAGLGGGSSDAAHAIKMLDELFLLNVSQKMLMQYAADLGSDCAFFIQQKPLIGTSRGEVLRAIDFSLTGKFLVIVKPEIHVSTRDAFSGIKPKASSLSVEEILVRRPVREWEGLLVNDFEDTVFKKYPAIASVKERLYALGASYASMTGSGSAVFGIFESEADVSGAFPDVVHWSGFLT